MVKRRKTKNKVIKNNIYNNLSNLIKDILNINQTAKIGATKSVNAYLVIRNILIGKRIDEEFLTNRKKDYGKRLIKNLSKELSKYGKAFDFSSLYQYWNFYKKFKKILDSANPKSLLPWTHYRELLHLNNTKEREWYESESNKCGWSYRQLKRNIKSNYYHRVLSHQIEHKPNQILTINPNDFIKSPYIFDFLDFKNNQKYKESELEEALLVHLRDLILELGKGYNFTGNQIHLRTNEQDYYIDLVFYNSIMKCNVLIDLKVGKINPKDIGQMLIYLNLYDKKYKQPSDNPSIGIILSSDTNYDVVKYLTLKTHNHVVSAKYMTYLPSKEELLNEIQKCKARLK